MRKIDFAAHAAYLDEGTGYGLLAMPNPEDDLPWDSELSLSLHGADWDAALAYLRESGWEIQEDETGWLLLVGIDGLGRRLVALYWDRPLPRDLTMHDLAEAHRSLAQLAGLVSEAA